MTFPDFSKKNWTWITQPNYTGKANLVDGETLGVPVGIYPYGHSIRKGLPPPEFTDSPEFVEFTCTVPPNREISSKGKCWIQMYDDTSKTSSAYSIYSFNLTHGASVNKTFVKPILNHSLLFWTLVNDDDKMIYFGKPGIRFFFKDFKKVQNTIVEDKGKYKKISAQFSKDDGKTVVRSIGIHLPYPTPKPVQESRHFPIIANTTHIIGSDLFDSTFLVMWEKECRTTPGYTYENHFTMSFDPYSTTKFTLSYFLVEMESTSLMDALEKWHSLFPEIYNRHDKGNGGWVSNSALTRFFNASNGNEFEDRDIYLAHWQWGNSINTRKEYLPAYSYTEPLFVHTKIPYDPDISDAEFLESMRICASDFNKTHNASCQFVLDHYVVDEAGKIQKKPYDSWAIVPIALEGELYDDFVKRGLRFGTIVGYGLDSYNSRGYFHFQVDENDKKMTTEMPFFYLNANGRRYIPIYAGLQRFYNTHKEIYPIGHMENGHEIAPQNIQFFIHTGYEIFLFQTGSFTLTPTYLNILIYHRYEVGSLACSNLVERYYDNTGDYTESIFAIHLAFGYFVATHVYKNVEVQQRSRKYYLQYGDIFRKVCNNTEYFANNRGKVTLEVPPDQQNPELNPTYGNDYQGVMTFCELENQTVTNPYCYTTVFLDYIQKHTLGNKFKRTAIVTVDTNNLECYFIPSDMTCSVNGNKATVVMSAPSGNTFRTSVLRYKKYNENDNSDNDNSNENTSSNGASKKKNKGVIIAAVIIPIVVITGVVVGLILFKKRKFNQGSKTQIVTF